MLVTKKTNCWFLGATLAVALIVSAWFLPRPAAALEFGQGCCVCEGTEKSAWKIADKEPDCGQTCQPKTYKFFKGLACDSPELEKTLTPAPTPTAPAAAAPASSAIIPGACLGDAPTSACGLSQLVGVFVNVANYIWAIAGSLAFLMFVLGGFYWLTAAGSPEQIKKGKTFVTNAVIGLVIIFGARALVNFAVGVVAPRSPTPVEGAGCGPSRDGVTPRFVKVGEELKCIEACEALKSETKKNYSCGQSTGGDCVIGLCSGGKDNVCCVR